jgi:predicted acetyltransferase
MITSHARAQEHDSTSGRDALANGRRAPASATSSPVVTDAMKQVRVIAAAAVDHVAIHRFLVNVAQAPSSTEFQAQLEDPSYEPSDRLLIKHGGQIVSHLRMSHRELRFGPLWVPVCILADVATLPEFRRRGYAGALVVDAQRRMQQQGARLGLLKTRNPSFYRRLGWVPCFRTGGSKAGPRDILSQLSDYFSARRPQLETVLDATPPAELNIRLWRHVEQAALMRLYDQFTSSAFGALRRGDEYWRWLISRRGYDRIYVAIEGRDKLELDDTCQPIVGYATMSEGRIVELITAPDRTDVAAKLLQRACGDAIEHDYHPVRLDVPPDHPLQPILDAAAGSTSTSEAKQAEVVMVRLAKPLAFLAQLCPLLLERARDANLPLPCELGLLLDGQKYRLVLTRRSAKVLPGKLGRSYLTCSTADLTALLLGHADPRHAMSDSQPEFSTSVAHDLVRILFPQLPLWLPAWDDLPASD